MASILSLNPYTEKILKKFSPHTEKQAIQKAQASQITFKSWSSLSIEERCNYLRKVSNLLKKNKQEYATIMSREMGKPIKQAIAEVEKCAWTTEYFADNSPQFLKNEEIKTEAYKSYITFEPIGVILGIMPWNFPFWQVFRFAIPALAAGNTILIKHSSNVPQCSLVLEKIFSQSLPKNVYQNLLIEGKTVKKIIESNIIQGISLTGSVEAGRKIAEASGKMLKKTVLELGGSDPYIILEDANFKNACETAIQSRIINNGQSCIAAKRFIVIEKKYEEIKSNLIISMKNQKLGSPMQETTTIGPLARKDLVQNLQKQLQNAIKKGAKIIYQENQIPKKGFFFPPTILLCSLNNPLLQEETFGPLMVIVKVKNEKEAIEVANNTNFGLGASLWTQDLEKAEQLAKQIQAGTVAINGMVKSDPRLPFGGIKESGYGRELGSYGIKEFTNIKTIVVNR